MTSQQRPLSTLRYGCLALLASPSTTSLPIGLLFRFSLMLDVQELRLNSMRPNPALNQTPAGWLSPARRSPVSLLR
jgi:hypothetical protein